MRNNIQTTGSIGPWQIGQSYKCRGPWNTATILGAYTDRRGNRRIAGLITDEDDKTEPTDWDAETGRFSAAHTSGLDLTTEVIA